MANETHAEHARRCDVKVKHTPWDCPNRPPEPSTAQLLGTYARELTTEGVDPTTVRTLVIEAARHLLRDGGELVVRPNGAGPFGDEAVSA